MTIKKPNDDENRYEKCPVKSCGANFNGDCRQPVLKCYYRMNGIIQHESFNNYWKGKEL